MQQTSENQQDGGEDGQACCLSSEVPGSEHSDSRTSLANHFRFRGLTDGRQASYDKLRVLLLSGRLATAVALVRANSTSNSKRRREDISTSVSLSTNQRPKQRQRPSAAGPVKPSRSGDGTSSRRKADSSAITKTTRNQNTLSQVTRKTGNQTVAMARSTPVDESAADMFTTKSRHTHTSRGVQAQVRGTRENTRDLISPPLTRSNSNTRTSNDMPTRSHSRVHANPMSRTNSKAKASSYQKSKALSSLENLV